MIFGPDGKPLCEPLGDGGEGILTADINLRDIDYPKAFIDVVGHCKKKPEIRNPHPWNCHPCAIERLSEDSKFDVACNSFGNLLTRVCVIDARPDLLSLLVNPTKDTPITKMAK